MKAIEDLIDRVEKYRHNIPEIITKAVRDNEEIVLDWVTEDQLFERGVDSTNRPIASREPYSPITISIKREKGQPTSRVTLRDSGDFHQSFYIEYSNDEFRIRARDWKTGDLVDRYGPEILGLTDENLQDILRSYILPDLLKEFRRI